MSTTEISIFRREGVDIRVMSIDGEPWWVASDVAQALGYSATSAMLRSLDEDDKGVRDLHTPGGMQAVAIVSEPGMYSAILRSQASNAADFKRWVTREVLPTIRKTGSYSVVVQREIPQDFASALREFAAEVEAHEHTKAALDVAQPRAEAWDALASAEGDFSVGDAAKVLARDGVATGPQRLFGQLQDIKWIYRGGGDREWHAYAERVEKGYLAEKLSYRYHPGTGERIVNTPQVRVTVKGIERLRMRLHVGGLVAVS